MDFPFFADPDRTRFCYLRLRRLKEAIKDPRIADALVRQLDVPGSDKKLAAVDKRIDALRGQDALWRGVPAAEVLAATIFKARPHAPEAVDAFFRPVPRLQDLSKPLSEWLHASGLTPLVGGVPRTGRANLIGYRGGQFIAKPRAIGIEAINDPAEIAETLASKTVDNTHAAYVACTPAVAAAFLWSQADRARHWDAEALERGLRSSGRGLLMIEGDAVAQVIIPKERNPENSLLQQLAVDIQAAGKS